MANIIFSWLNHVARASSSLSATSSVAGMGPANLQDAMQTRRCRTAVGVTTQMITVSFGVARDVQVMGFSQPWNAGDVFTADGEPQGIMAATDTIQYQLSNDADFTTLLYDSGALSCNMDPVNRLSVKLLPASVNALYARYIFNAPSLAAAPGYLDLGYLWAAPIFQPQRNFNYGAGPAIDDLSGVTESLNGARFVDKIAKRRSATFSLGSLTEAEANTSVPDLLAHVGVVRPVLIIPDPASPYLQRQAILGFLTNMSDPIARANLFQFQRPFAILQVM